MFCCFLHHAYLLYIVSFYDSVNTSEKFANKR